MREIVFDTETTGLKPEEGERVVEIGAVELVNRFPTGKTYHVYINPDGRQVHPEALRVHGLKDEFLADKSKFSDIADEFLAFIADATLVAHNAGFDMGFINAELNRLDVDPITDDRVIDTLALARRKHPMGPNSLDALCNRYGVDNSRRDLHGALLDSELLAEVYIEMTGGRQAALVLDQKAEQQTDTQKSTNITRPRRSRDKPLPSRLSAGAEASHRKFVDSLGENPIWARYLNDR
ncbi:MAG: DNA polymerase III subunit epsilon [Pseudomonadota bacterium]